MAEALIFAQRANNGDKGHKDYSRWFEANAQKRYFKSTQETEKRKTMFDKIREKIQGK